MRFMTYCKNTLLISGKGLITTVLIMTPFIGLNTVYPHFLPHLNAIVSHHRLVCTFFRWAILVITSGFWPMLCRYIGKLRHWSADKTADWIKQRTRIMVWFILFELIINANLLLELIHDGISP